MLAQLHWQNRKNLKQTEFVAQTELTGNDQLMPWVQELLERRRSECPEGWEPMVCDQVSEYFVWQADEPTVVKS